MGDNAKPEAIPYSDKIMNVEKYAFVLSDNKATTYSENSLFTASVNGGLASWQYSVRTSASDVTVKAYTSEDLINWAEASPTASGTSGEFNLFKVEQFVPAGGKLFFKLEVNQ